MMKEFGDLKFNAHPNIVGKQALMKFENGYSVSVLYGSMFYSNGVDTYELAVLKDGRIDYSTPITDDVLGYITEDEVTDAMKKIQELPCSTQD